MNRLMKEAGIDLDAQSVSILDSAEDILDFSPSFGKDEFSLELSWHRPENSLIWGTSNSFADSKVHYN